jgi:hypothetical protein
VLGNTLAAPGAVRVNCAAHRSAVNKSFQISGVSKLNEIKRKREGNLFQEDLLSAAVWPTVGGGGGEGAIPLVPSWPVPGNQPPFFLFLKGRPLGFHYKLPAASPVWSVADCELEG